MEIDRIIEGVYNAGRAKEALGREPTQNEWALFKAGFTPASVKRETRLMKEKWD